MHKRITPAGGYPGTHSRAKATKIQNPMSHPEGVGVDATGIWEEASAHLPGDLSVDDANPVGRRGDGRAKSAEGIVAHAYEERGART